MGQVIPRSEAKQKGTPGEDSHGRAQQHDVDIDAGYGLGSPFPNEQQVITTFGEMRGKEEEKPVRKRKRENEEPKVPFEMKKELEEFARKAKRVKDEAQPGRESSAASVLLNAAQMMKRIVDGGPNLKRAVTSVRKSLELLDNELKGTLDEKDE